MKKIIFFFLIAVLTFTGLFSEELETQPSRFTGAFSAGYVFKHDDCTFKEVYGHGVVNVITADGCYYFCNPWGVGAKASYFRAKGLTTFLSKQTLLQEVPITVYLRRIKYFWCDLQAYASLGGGALLIKEKSYLCDACLTKGVGEIEIGFNYPVWRCFNVTTAFRYLFSRHVQDGEKLNVGGFDMRAGIAFVF